MPKYTEKEIQVEGHDVKITIKGSKAGEIGPKLAEKLEGLTLEEQEDLEGF